MNQPAKWGEHEHEIAPAIALGLAQTGVMSIALAGAGGTGSIMASRLMQIERALVAKRKAQGLMVDVYDPEPVTPANIGRQLFFPSEVGRNKAEALVQRANLAYGSHWRFFPHRYVGQRCNVHGRDGWPYDILVTCVDSGAARRSIWEGLRQGSVGSARYWLDLGNEARTGQVVLGEVSALESAAESAALPTVVERYPEFYDGTIPESDLGSCTLAEALGRQDLFVNMAVADEGAQLLWRLLSTGRTPWIGAFINLDWQQPVTRIPAPVPAPRSERLRAFLETEGDDAE